MPVTLQTVTGNIEHITGTTPNAARLRFRMNRPDWTTTGEIFAPRDVEAVADTVTGAFSVQLQQTDLLQQGSVYKAVLYYRDVISGEDREYTVGQFEVPAGGPHELTDLLEAGFVNPENAQTIADWLAQAQASAVAAAGSATAAAASADQAEVAAIAAGAPIFPTIAAGIAGVANGAVFMVPSGGDGLVIYRRNGTGADNLGGIRADTFDTRAQYATAVAAGFVPVAGRTYWVGGLPFQGSPGATWTGLTGLITHPLHPVTLEHYGGGTSAAGVSSATNNAALAAWYASVLANQQIDRVLNFGYGSYNHTTWPAVDVSNVGFRGLGATQTIMLNLSNTSDGPSFGPAEGAATGNTRFGNFLEGIQFTRSGTGATAGTGVTWRFCSQPRMRGVRISQYYNQMEVIAGQDEDFSDYELYGPFYFDFVSPARPNSFCLRVRQGLKSDGTYQPKWQSRHRGFNIAGCWNTDNAMILTGGDGSMYSDGYVNGGRNSLLKLTGLLAAEASGANYNSSHFSNVYLDGGRPSQNVSYCIDCDDTTGNYLTAVFQGGVIANSKTAVVNVRGDNDMRIQFDGVFMNGWIGEEAPRLWDVNNANARVFINNCLMQFSHRSIRLQAARSAQINGGWLLNGSNDGFTGTAIQITGLVDDLNINGLFLGVFGGSSAFSDTGTGRRNFSNLLGAAWPSSVVPAFTFSGGNTGVTYTGTRELRYERMGPLVYIAMTLQLASKGTSTGEARITGLPFGADTFTTYPIAGRVNNLQRSRAGTGIVPDLNFDVIRFVYNFDNGTIAAQASLSEADITDSTIFRVAGWYPIVNAGRI
ncbi:MAG: hypothetical protein MUD11_07495 [Rhodobacteraceae bacterium]|jgi:hypothetical protein|nr:hypothetical protein [Paracoccaceae bacterium]